MSDSLTFPFFSFLLVLRSKENHRDIENDLVAFCSCVNNARGGIKSELGDDLNNSLPDSEQKASD
jgi:hypothetical protein